MEYHARRSSTVCAAQGKCWKLLSDVVGTCVLHKRDDGIPLSASSFNVCNQKAMIACLVYVVRPYVLSKGDDGITCPP